ncbi:hypothetical protein [Nocardia miyunensis]|uniref:hypothetical protein n=1 Tax=Nocardia miyunensis TaxID=282684 RepID=UPI0012F52590|nr:hypothetical protein [Nocardia miyunensis]
MSGPGDTGLPRRHHGLPPDPDCAATASGEVVTPQDWAASYRSLFGLPRVHVTAPGFVVLPLTDSIAAVNTPEPLGVSILGELVDRGIPGPVLVRARPPRRTFLVVADRHPSPDHLARLERRGIDIGPHRGNVVLPTGFGRHTAEGRWWARPPRRDESLPLLSELVSAAIAVLDGLR